MARKEDAFKAHATIVARSATGGDSAGTCRLLKVVCQDLGRRRARQSVKAKRASRVPKDRTVIRGGPPRVFRRVGTTAGTALTSVARTTAGPTSTSVARARATVEKATRTSFARRGTCLQKVLR